MTRLGRPGCNPVTRTRRPGIWGGLIDSRIASTARLRVIDDLCSRPCIAAQRRSARNGSGSFRPIDTPFQRQLGRASTQDLRHVFDDPRQDVRPGSRCPARRLRHRRRQSRGGSIPRLEFLERRTLLATVTVDIVNFAFSPPNVTINSGDTIHWVWQADDHSSTSVSGSVEQWDSGVHNTGFIFDHIFTYNYIFVYYCTNHEFDNGNGTAGGMSGTITVNAAPTLTSIAVTPANPRIPNGETEQFTATGTFSDNSTEDLTSQVTWASATMSVATISNASGSAGLATAVGQGTSMISATLDGISGSTALTVSPAALVSIAVTPADPGVNVGQTQQFTAIATLTDHSTGDATTQVHWISTSTPVAIIVPSGVATGLAVGVTMIDAVMDGITGLTSMTVTVTEPPVAVAHVQLAQSKKHQAGRSRSASGAR
jgi:plastocyanin